LDKFDVAIIGGGTAGYAAGIHASQLGANVALIEKHLIGGTCLNRGCIPTKAMVRSGELLLKIKQASEFGIDIEGARVNFARLMEHKDKIVKRLVSGVELLIKANHINLLRGEAQFLSANSLQVGDRTVFADKMIIASGSQPAKISIPGSDLAGVLTTDDIFDLKELPDSIVIIGGGYIGIEFAAVFGALGTRVTVLEALPRCLATVEEEIANVLIQVLRRTGCDIRTNALVQAVTMEEKTLHVACKTPNGEERASGEIVLIAVGRRPYSEGLGLGKLGVRQKGGAITVNDCLETDVRGIYAIGDVLGRSMLAHVGFHEAEVAARNAVGQPCRVDYRVIPKCVFTYPEIASVGMTEKEAKESGQSYRISKFPFGASGAAVTMNETTGMIKMICASADSSILGTHIIGPHASELIAEVALGMKLRATAQDIAGTIHAHPTLAEAMREAAMGQVGGALHTMRGKG
jgi:dihydrolipoamide dehydrogenase